MIGRLRVVFVLASFMMIALLFIPFQYLFLKTGIYLQSRLPHRFHQLLAWLLGIRIHTYGKMVKGSPLFLVSNHISWSDIIVLSAVGEVSFIAKSEVKQWPFFGLLAVLQRSIFVERKKRSKIGKQILEISRRLALGDTIVLFAEGTTSDGNRILPFKTSLFSAVETAICEVGAASVTIQPVAIIYTSIHGMPMGRYHRLLISWPGDVELFPHLIGLLKKGAIDVDVRFGEPMVIKESTNRKILAHDMEERVRTLFQASLFGRKIKNDEEDHDISYSHLL